MAGLPFIDADYCQYAQWGYKKPTRIWGSPDILEVAKRCDGITCLNLQEGHPEFSTSRRPHKIILSTNRYKNPPREVKYRIPEALIRDLARFEEYTGSPGHKDPGVEVRTGHIGATENSAESEAVQEDTACNSVEKGSARQLVMTLKATTSMGRDRYIQALIDTGAEANLIRASLFASGEMRPSTSPLSLRTADGSVMRGGVTGGDSPLDVPGWNGRGQRMECPGCVS